MKKPAGVIAAAVVLLVMTIFGFLGTLLTTATMFVNRYPIIPRSPGIEAIAAIVNLLLFCFLVFCIWTVVGLFHLRPGARAKMIVVGAVTTAFCGLFSAAFHHVYGLIPPGLMIPGLNVQINALALAMSLIYLAVALIGLWWIIYFSLPHVRQAFHPVASVPAKL